MRFLLRPFIMAVALLVLSAPVALAAGKYSVPGTAQGLARTLDVQLAERLGLDEGPAKGTSIIITTPVSLEDLDQSSPLARLMAEEMTSWFVSKGYRVKEIRKGKSVLMRPATGELNLTRDPALVDDRFKASSVLLTGTYTQTSDNIRFNIRLLHATDGEVLAMASRTMRLTREAAELLDSASRERKVRVRPSVNTSYRPWALFGPGAPASSWSSRSAITKRRQVAQNPDVIDLTE